MIVKELKFSAVNAAVYNPRIRLTKGDPEYQNIASSLERFGLVQTLVWNKRSGNLVGGHQRMWILQDGGATKAHFTIVDLDDDQERQLNLILNKVSGRWDRPKLEEVLSAMAARNLDLSTLGFNPVELNDILKAKPKKTARDPDDAPGPTADELATTREGDIYELTVDGKPLHRLLCGDSTRHEDLSKLMDGTKARLIFCDPPYGVDFKGTYRGQEACAPILNDALKANELEIFLFNAFTAAHAHTLPNAAFYCFHAFRTQMVFETALNRAGWEAKQQLIWRKHFTLNRHAYHWAHEPFFFGGKNGQNPEWFGPRTDTTIHDTTAEDFAKMGKQELVALLTEIKDTSTVWHEPKDPAASVIHPCQKPVSLAKKAFRNSSMPQETVLELFAGSGSTLIAAELENRSCRAMEQSRGHCDAIVRRYLETFTESKATRNGQPFTLEDFDA